MFANFLPPSVVDLKEEAIALLQQFQPRGVQVPFEQGTTEIATAYVRHCPARSVSHSNAAPILLLPGFDSSLLKRLFPLLRRYRCKALGKWQRYLQEFQGIIF